MNVITRINMDLAARLSRPTVPWQVESLTWRLPGGADIAKLRVDLLEEYRIDAGMARSWLGEQIAVHSNAGEVIWNGWIESVILIEGRFRTIWSTENLSSRVIARYRQSSPLLSPLPEWSYSDWAENDERLTWLGAKESLVTLDQADEDRANQVAASQLASQGSEWCGIKLLDADQEARLEVVARGWWQRLAWTLDGEESGVIAHLSGGKSQLSLGVSGSERLAQSFLCTEEDFTLGQVCLRVAMTGDTADDLLVKIYSDQNGAPGTLVDGGSLPNYRIEGGWRWLTWSMDTPLLLTSNTLYWLVVERDGSLDSDNYFEIETDDGRGYAAGSLYAWNGSQWAFKRHDMRFCLLAVAQSTDLMKDVAEKVVDGGVLSGVQVWQESGIWIPRWRALEKTRMEALGGWLASGCVDGNRLTAMVDAQRILEVLVLPRELGPALQLGEDGWLSLVSSELLPNALDLLGRRVLLPGMGEEEVGAVKWTVERGLTIEL